MTRRRLHATALAAILLTLIPLTLSAQRMTRRVFIRATTAAGEPVLDLTAADLRVTENGNPREVTRLALGKAPMRIVLMVDSSSAMSPMINNFRAALDTFIDTLPAEHEIAFISTGGQIRVRTQPSTDRLKLKMETARFASDAGANAFLDTLMEADKRFLKTAPGQWPVFVIVTTDNGESRSDLRLDEFNKFVADFMARCGSAHGVIVAGKQVGAVSDLVLNFVENAGGVHSSINTANSLPEKLKAIAERIGFDHLVMADRYEVDFTGDAKLKQPIVNVGVTREGVRLEMSPRRPF
jgi:hypothetical protein